MLSYSRIVSDAYRITMRYRILWLFGFFVIGGFNVNFLTVHGPATQPAGARLRLWEMVNFLENHPGTLAAVSLGILLAALIGLIITNWSRVMLILTTESILKTKFPETPQQFTKSSHCLWPVIRMSLLTSTFMVVIAAVLFVPPFFLVSDANVQLLLWTVAAVLFLPLAFTVSCVNIFATFFIILFQQRLGAALNLATDFFVSKWTEILGLAAVLAVIYGVCFAAGISLIYVIRVLFNLALVSTTRLGISEISAMMSWLGLALGLLWWLFLAGLNVFFNTSLQLLFLQLVTPIEKEKEGLKESVAVAEPT